MPIDPFDAEGNPTNTGTRWKKWLSNFELFLCNAFVLSRKTCAGNPEHISSSPGSYVQGYRWSTHWSLHASCKCALRETHVPWSSSLYIHRSAELLGYYWDCAFGNEEDNNWVIEKSRFVSNTSLTIKYSITLAKVLEKSQAYESAMKALMPEIVVIQWITLISVYSASSAKK